MRLSIRTKMFFLVTFVLMGTILAVLWKTRSIFFEDKYDFVRQLSSKLSSSTGRLAQEKLSELQNNMALFVSTRESLKRVRSGKELNNLLFERNPQFVALSVQKNSNKVWSTDWLHFQSNTSWSETSIETVLRSVNYSTLSTGAVQISRVLNSANESYFLISFLADLKEENQLKSELSSVVALVKSDFLTEVVRDFKGDLNTVFIIDQKGYIVAHPQDSLLGSENLKHPVVKTILEGRESGSGQFELSNGESVIANFNPIPNTNLYIVITTPEKQAFLAARDLIITVITFGFGFLIIGAVLAFVISSRITQPLNELKEIAEIIGSGNFKTEVQIKASDEVGDLAKSIDKMKTSLLERDEQIEHSKMALVQSEKMSAFGQLSAGIAHEVKNPLAGILGHAQLAKSKAKDSDVAKHLDMIEKETRRTKEIIENLMKFARAEKPELSPTDLQETVSRAVDLVDHQLSLQGVKILRDFKPVSQVQANSNQIQQVLLNLMMNAGHAMESCNTKQLKVSVEDLPECVQIRIEDTGAGMTPEVQKRIFEPFFTTKPAGKGTGLGLSVSIGIVQDHKGKIYVKSEVGKGTTFFIDIPKNTSTQVVSQNSKVELPKSESLNSEVKLSSLQSSSEKVASASTKSGISALPTFNPTSVLDKEVQRDYLKESAQKVNSKNTSDSIKKEPIKTIEEIKKEAQEILKKEKELLKQEESKLSQALKQQEKEIEKLSSDFSVLNHVSSTKESEVILDTSIELKSNSALNDLTNNKTLNSDLKSIDEDKDKVVEIKSKAHSNIATQSTDNKNTSDSSFKVSIRKPKLKA